MKQKYITFFALFIWSVCSIMAENTEKLNYVVTYKWGLIQKDAGEAEITTSPHSKGYQFKLTAKTKPWADRIYKVRDTLISVVDRHTLFPHQYTRIAHEKNRYSRDDISFDHSGEKVKGVAKKVRESKDGVINKSEKDLEGLSPTFDLLSVFFFLRKIDYENLKKGETITSTLFSGDQVEKLTVSCLGKEQVKLKDKSEHEAWHIVFKFTSKGGTKSSDDIDCWISTTPQHIPLLVIASLPIGHVRINYMANA